MNAYEMAGYRVSNIQRATVNGAKRIIFTAHKRTGGSGGGDAAFVHIGQFSAPSNTRKMDLWKVAAAAYDEAAA